MASPLSPSNTSSSTSSSQPVNESSLQKGSLKGRTVSPQQQGVPNLFAYAFELWDYVVDTFNLNPERTSLIKQYGAGIRNGGNSCYMDSILQSIRASINLSELPPADSDTSDTRKELQSIFDVIETKSEQERRTLTVYEINKLRQSIIGKGFSATNYSQEDASQFLDFLLDKIGIPEFSTVTISIHQYGEPIQHHANNRILHLGIVGGEERYTLRDLLLNNSVNEERDSFLSAIKNKEDLPKVISTIQSIHLLENNLPQLLPICLERYVFDKEKKARQKITSFVEPSQEIEINIVGDQNKRAVYTLSALIDYEGVNPPVGHYVAYIPKNVNGEIAWLEYNSNGIHLYNNPKQDLKRANETIFEVVGKSSYLFFYKLKEVK